MMHQYATAPSAEPAPFEREDSSLFSAPKKRKLDDAALQPPPAPLGTTVQLGGLSLRGKSYLNVSVLSGEEFVLLQGGSISSGLYGVQETVLSGGKPGDAGRRLLTVNPSITSDGVDQATMDRLTEAVEVAVLDQVETWRSFQPNLAFDCMEVFGCVRKGTGNDQQGKPWPSKLRLEVGPRSQLLTLEDGVEQVREDFLEARGKRWSRMVVRLRDLSINPVKQAIYLTLELVELVLDSGSRGSNSVVEIPAATLNGPADIVFTDVKDLKPRTGTEAADGVQVRTAGLRWKGDQSLYVALTLRGARIPPFGPSSPGLVKGRSKVTMFLSMEDYTNLRRNNEWFADQVWDRRADLMKNPPAVDPANPEAAKRSFMEYRMRNFVEERKVRGGGLDGGLQLLSDPKFSVTLTDEELASFRVSDGDSKVPLDHTLSGRELEKVVVLLTSVYSQSGPKGSVGFTTKLKEMVLKR